MPDFIKLPSERVEQLRLLSKSRGLPIADLIAEYVQEQIKLDHLDPAIPTIDVRRVGGRVVIDFGEFKRIFDVEMAEAFAITLRLFATPKTPASHPRLSAENTDALNTFSQDLRDLNLALSGAEKHVGISRRGTSIKVSGENGVGKRTLAPSIARELAAVVEAVARG